MLREAIEHHRQGRLDEAEKAYRDALVTNALDSEALRGLGAVRRLRGDLAESAQLLQRAHELAPEQPKLLMMLATVHFESGNIAAARDTYERVLALDPNTTGAHTALGHIVMMGGEATLAEQYFRTALRVQEDPQALSGLGTLALNNGDADTAMKYLTRAADLAPNDASVAFALGRGFAARGMAAFAEQAFRNALRLSPGLPQANNALGQLLIQDKRVAEAEPYFRALTGVRGFELACELGLADVARMQGRFDAAVDFYQRALEIRPDHEPCFEAMIWSLGKLGRGDEVQRALDQRIIDFPDQIRWRAIRARIRDNTGRPADAASDWQWLLDRNPQDAEAAVELARAQERNGELDLALTLAEAAAKLAPGHPELSLIGVRSYMRKGEDAAAHEWLSTMDLDKLDQNLARTCLNLSGHLYDRAGEMAGAARQFREAQAGLPGMLPALASLPADYEAAIAKPEGEAWKHAPILLIGAPGSGVERIAALLSDQTGVNLLRDRVQGTRNDCFDSAPIDLTVEETSSTDIEIHREAYLATLRARGFDLDKPLVDWIPRFDAHHLLVARRIMPGTKVILVDRDARDALLNWLGFGWLPYFALSQFDSAVDWLSRAFAHLRFVDVQGGLPHIVVDADKVLADPDGAGAELARFIGIDALRPGEASRRAAHALGGLPNRFAAGHWQAYADVLGEAFARLPV